jgi:hypothetical protein
MILPPELKKKFDAAGGLRKDAFQKTQTGRGGSLLTAPPVQYPKDIGGEFPDPLNGIPLFRCQIFYNFVRIF